MADISTTAVVSPLTAQTSVLVRIAQRFGVDPKKLHETLKATAFRGEVSNEQFMALLIVADQYKLNPITRELYAFPDKNNGIVPVVGFDGWARIVNEHPQFDGLEFLEDDNGAWCSCIIHRKDRSHPTQVREYLAECRRSTGPWGSHPRRMLRHKAFIQCARIAFGFAGIYDPDEAERIVEGERVIDAQHKPLGLGVGAFMAATETPVQAEPVETILATPEPEPEPAGASAPTIAEVSKLIMAGKLDEAADLARSFPPEERKILDSQIAAHAKRKAAKDVV